MCGHERACKYQVWKCHRLQLTTKSKFAPLAFHIYGWMWCNHMRRTKKKENLNDLFFHQCLKFVTQLLGLTQPKQKFLVDLLQTINTIKSHTWNSFDDVAFDAYNVNNNGWNEITIIVKKRFVALKIGYIVSIEVLNGWFHRVEDIAKLKMNKVIVIETKRRLSVCIFQLDNEFSANLKKNSQNQQIC